MGDNVGAIDRAELVRARQRTRIWMFAAVAATAALIGIGAYLLSILSGSTGDEPPIRVKGGSIDLELIASDGASNTWDYDSAQDHWSIHQGGRGNNDLGFAVLTTSATNACPPVGQGMKEISFSFSDGAQESSEAIIVKSTGNKIRVTGKGLSNSGRVLKYGTAGIGWPSKMTYKGATGAGITCDLANGDRVIILEW